MKQLLFVSLLLLLVNCSKNDNETEPEIDTQNFVGTWIYEQTTSSYQIVVGAGPTVTSFAEIPAPGYHTDAKYSVTSSALVESKLIFTATYTTQFGDVVRECTCTLVDKNTLSVIHILRINGTIKGSAELVFTRKS
jgi:hypothetical protein